MSLETKIQERPTETLTPPQEAQAILDGYHGSLPFPPEAVEAPQPEPQQAISSAAEANTARQSVRHEAILNEPLYGGATPAIDILPAVVPGEKQRRGRVGRFVMRILGH